MMSLSSRLKCFLLFFFLVFIINFQTTVLAIDCYSCSSNTHVDCTEKFDEDNSKLNPIPCDVFEGRYCIKTTGLWEGEIGTKRFCSSRDHGTMCEYIKRLGDEREYRSCVYTCSRNGCNHSSSITINHTLLALVVVMSCLILKK